MSGQGDLSEKPQQKSARTSSPKISSVVLFLVAVLLMLAYLIFRPHLALGYGIYMTSCVDCPKNFQDWFKPGLKTHERTERLGGPYAYYTAHADCESDVDRMFRESKTAEGFDCRPEYRFEWGW